MEISTILSQIDLGSIALPEFQRGYVWNRDQVRTLMESLYRRYPVGSLMVWLTKTEGAPARRDGPLAPGSVKLLLDGQQRITTLYGIIRGEAPPFFDGDRQAFTGLRFNLESESFEFYAPMKMQGDLRWVDVTALMKSGAGKAIAQLYKVMGDDPACDLYAERLNTLDGIKSINLHIEEVAGMDKTVDVVVDIFNRVNSGGTKLSKGDLALAKICAEWPDARVQMKARLARWAGAGYQFRMDWLLRTINAILTGEAMFAALKNVDIPTFRKGLDQAETAIDKLLVMIASRLGLDSDSVLGGSAAFPLMARYLMQRKGHVADYRERDKLLYWYVQSFLWGRYAGSTEQVLNQDLDAIEGPAPLDALIGLLRQNRGDLRLQSSDFNGWSQGARFYPFLYMLTRVFHARDWDTGVELSNHLLGHKSRLELHHIFPKALLYKHGYNRPDVNALANFTFLTQETNLLVTDRNPAEYLPKFAAKHPGVLESHWIPMDPHLWHLDRYQDFLAARRELLAQAGNAFLESLLQGVSQRAAMPEVTLVPDIPTMAPAIPLSPLSPANPVSRDEAVLDACDAWVMAQGLPRGEYMYELLDPTTNQVTALIDLAWPQGLQQGYSQPLAFLVEANQPVEQALNAAGYRWFTNLDTFRQYVEREILARAS
jgi:hypothetical protein